MSGEQFKPVQEAGRGQPAPAHAPQPIQAEARPAAAAEVGSGERMKEMVFVIGVGLLTFALSYIVGSSLRWFRHELPTAIAAGVGAAAIAWARR